MPSPRGRRNRAPAPQGSSLFGEDLAAFAGAVLLALRFGHSLALAAVLALAGVAGAVTRALALALVDAGTLDRAAGGLLLLRLGLRGSRCEQRSHGGGDDRALHQLFDHRFNLPGRY